MGGSLVILTMNEWRNW